MRLLLEGIRAGWKNIGCGDNRGRGKANHYEGDTHSVTAYGETIMGPIQCVYIERARARVRERGRQRERKREGPFI